VSDSIDLDAYFDRIGYRGDAAPTLETLQEIHRLHPEAIPFENLSSLFGQPVHLDSTSLQAKLIEGGRGGYCFEHNLLLTRVLRQLGYRVTCLAARVRWNVPDDVITPRGHMLMQVEVDGREYLADVGFGGATLTGPIELVEDDHQETPHGLFRLEREGSEYALRIHIERDWATLYRFDLQEQHEADYEVSSWYVSTYPKSRFRHELIAGRADEEGRHVLFNGRYRLYRGTHEVEERHCESAEEVRELLIGTFGIRLPDVPEMDQRFERLIAERGTLP